MKPETTTVYEDIEKVRRVLNWFKDGRAEPEDQDAPEAFERVVTALLINERIAHAR